jgi:4'-phosphopantetheinyl transferase
MSLPGIEPAWTVPTVLPSSGLHVWRIPLAGADAAGIDGLSVDEVARARRLAEPSRWRFLAVRRAARTILSRYVGAPPATLRFVTSPRGKPSIGHPATDWLFNLSDSGDLALLAVSRAGPVGIDLERLRAVSRRAAIARRMLPLDAHEQVALTPGPAGDAVFLMHWTAFEARQKATGAGLSGPRAIAADWNVVHFVPAQGWIAALARPTGQEDAVCFYRYED